LQKLANYRPPDKFKKGRELIMSLLTNSSNPINDFYQNLERILSHTWEETGFGHIEIDCERIKQDKISITLRGSTHYRYVFSVEDLEKWLSNR
jgi:hypothetical protein